jgi:hypothetical protein
MPVTALYDDPRVLLGDVWRNNRSDQRRQTRRLTGFFPSPGEVGQREIMGTRERCEPFPGCFGQLLWRTGSARAERHHAARKCEQVFHAVIHFLEEKTLLFLSQSALGYVNKRGDRAVNLVIAVEGVRPIFDRKAAAIETEEQLVIDVRPVRSERSGKCGTPPSGRENRPHGSGG